MNIVKDIIHSINDLEYIVIYNGSIVEDVDFKNQSIITQSTNVRFKDIDSKLVSYYNSFEFDVDTVQDYISISEKVLKSLDSLNTNPSHFWSFSINGLYTFDKIEIKNNFTNIQWLTKNFDLLEVHRFNKLN